MVAYLALFVALGGSATALKGQNSVRSDDIKNGQVRSQDLARNSVKRNKIAKGAVNARRLAPRSVTTSRLVPAAVTSQIIAEGAVTSEQILDGGVLTNDLAQGAVGGGKLKKSAVGGGKIKGNAISEGKIADGAVTTAKIAAGAVTADRLGSGQIPVGKLSSTVVTAGDPFKPGLGGPALEFVQSASFAEGAAGDLLAIPGFGAYVGTCSALGASVSYRNGSTAPQSVFSDNGAADTDAVSFGVVSGGGTGAASNPADAVHLSIFSHEPGSGASTHAEVFAIRSGGSCTFYAWAISR